MFRTRTVGLIGLTVLLTQTLTAQATRTISGRVTSDPDRDPLSYANVILLGGTAGTVTNPDGRFTLGVPRDANVVLCVSMDSYQDARVDVPRSTQTVSVTLKEDDKATPMASCVPPGTTLVERDIKGRVVDSRTKSGLGEVRVKVGADVNDDETADDGRYALNEVAGDVVVRFSRAGYLPQEVRVPYDRFLGDVSLVRRDYVDPSYRDVTVAVTDAVSGVVLPGVMVSIDGAKLPEYEDEDEWVDTSDAGLATLIVPKGPFTLRASRIGWIEQRVNVAADARSTQVKLPPLPSTSSTAAPAPVAPPRAAPVTPAPAVVAPRPASAPTSPAAPAPAAPAPAAPPATTRPPGSSPASVLAVTDGSAWQIVNGLLTRTSPAPQLTSTFDTHNVGLNCLDGDASFRNTPAAAYAPPSFVAKPPTATSNGNSSSTVCANLGAAGTIVSDLRWPGSSLSLADQRAFREMLSALLTMLSSGPVPPDNLGLFTPRRAVVPLDASTGDWTFISDYTKANETMLLLEWPKAQAAMTLTWSPATQTCAQVGLPLTTTPLDGIPSSYAYSARAPDGRVTACADIKGHVLAAVVSIKETDPAIARRVSALLSRIQQTLNAAPVP